MSIDIQKAIDVMCKAAAIVVSEGIEFARTDDPHRFATLPAEFDRGLARQRLVLEYGPAGQVDIVLLFAGAWRGDEHVVELFRTTVQGPTGEGAH